MQLTAVHWQLHARRHKAGPMQSLGNGISVRCVALENILRIVTYRQPHPLQCRFNFLPLATSISRLL
jgi:hypothetical protein